MFGKKKYKIQALEAELQKKDALLQSTVQQIMSGTQVDKNNYTTYSSQVTALYKMFNAETEYGNEVLKPLITTRISFIAGGGISYEAEKSKTEKFWNGK